MNIGGAVSDVTITEWENLYRFSPKHFLLGFRKGVLINSLYGESIESIEYAYLFDNRMVVDLTFHIDLPDDDSEKLKLKTFIEDNFPVVVRNMSYVESKFL